MANCITRHIPNTITCCNLLSGCMAVIAACGGCVRTAFLWIIAGAAFDFCDGLSARLLHAYSPLGKELDSLADLTTFGLAPALLCRNLLSGIEWQAGQAFIPYIALILAAFSALRLAKFNIDERQTTSFLGLAVPADALFWCGICLWLQGASSPVVGWIVIAGIILFSFLLISEIPMFSLKFKNLGWHDNYIRYIFLAGSAILALAFGIKGVAPIILWYIILSVCACRK